MRRTLRCILVLMLLFSALVFGQETEHGGCVLATSSNGQTLTTRGKIVTRAHDMLLILPHCDQSVVLVFAGDPETNVPRKKLQRDQNLNLFKKYTEATYMSTGKSVCLHCAKYDVEASLTGELDIAVIPEGAKRDKLGFLRDKSGKIVGKAGFGHPTPLYRYRLVIESVSDVNARKIPTSEPIQ